MCVCVYVVHMHCVFDCIFICVSLCVCLFVYACVYIYMYILCVSVYCVSMYAYMCVLVCLASQTTGSRGAEGHLLSSGPVPDSLWPSVSL